MLLIKLIIKEKVEQLKNFLKDQGKKRVKIYVISAATNKGLKEVLRELYKKIEKYREIVK